MSETSETTSEPSKKSMPQKKQVSRSAKTSRSAPKPQDTATGGGNKMAWVVTLFNLVLLSGMAVAGYFGWQYWGIFQESQQQAQSRVELSLKAELQDALSQQKSLLDSQVTSLTSKIREQEEALRQQSLRLTELMGRRPSDWLLAEADYLVKMAGRKLWLEKDATTAISLLESADARLDNMQDSSLIPIRQAISQDIQALKALQLVSVTDTAILIQSLYKQVDELVIPEPNIYFQEEVAETTESLSDWRANLATLWQQIKANTMDISRRDQPIKPFINAQQQWLVREQLKYQLLLAQNALFSENPDLYVSAVRQSRNILVANFDETENVTKVFLQTINDLLALDFERNVPRALASSEPLQMLLEKKSAPVQEVSDMTESEQSL